MLFVFLVCLLKKLLAEVLDLSLLFFINFGWIFHPSSLVVRGNQLFGDFFGKSFEVVSGNFVFVSAHYMGNMWEELELLANGSTRCAYGIVTYGVLVQLLLLLFVIR